MNLIAETDVFQSAGRALFALGCGNAADGQRQFYIGENALVGDQIITLENKTDGMVAVRIPVAVGILLRGDVVDDKISGVIPVQTSDDVQKCGFTGTGRPQDSNKLIVPEI